MLFLFIVYLILWSLSFELKECEYRKVIEVTNPSKKYVLIDEEFYVEFNTEGIISEKKASSCSDMYPSYDEKTVIPHWFATDCDRTDTLLWMKHSDRSLVPESKNEVYIYYGCPKLKEGEENKFVEEEKSFSGYFVSFELDGCSSSFSDLDGKFPIGWDGKSSRTVTGFKPHTHQIYGSLRKHSSVGNFERIYCDFSTSSSSTNYISFSNHSHKVEFNTSTTAKYLDENVYFPPYINVPNCRRNYPYIRNNSIVFFNAEKSEDSNYFKRTDFEGMFVRGHPSKFSVGGGASNHSHSVDPYTGVFEDRKNSIECYNREFILDKDNVNVFSSISIHSHKHNLSHLKTTFYSNLPSNFKYLNFLIRKSGSTKKIEGSMKYLASSIPPFGFDIDTSYDGKYIRLGKGNDISPNTRHLHEFEINSNTVTTIPGKSNSKLINVNGTFFAKVSSEKHDHLSFSGVTWENSDSTILPSYGLVVLSIKEIRITYVVKGEEYVLVKPDRSTEYLVGGISFGVGFTVLLCIIYYCCCLPLMIDLISILLKKKKKKIKDNDEKTGDNKNIGQNFENEGELEEQNSEEELEDQQDPVEENQNDVAEILDGGREEIVHLDVDSEDLLHSKTSSEMLKKN